MNEATKKDSHESHKAAKRASRKGKGREVDTPLPTPITNQSTAMERTGRKDRKASAAHSWNEIVPWKWSSIADPSVPLIPAVFTKDARYFFVAVSASIKIYSVATGKIVSTLTSHSHQTDSTSNRITCLMINPTNPFQLFSGSIDGILRVWDFVDAQLLSTIDVGAPITHLCAHRDIADYVFVACHKPSKKDRKEKSLSVIMRVSLRTTAATSNATVQKSTELLVAGNVRTASGMGISASGKWLIVTGGSKVYVSDISRLKAGFVKFVCAETITCLSLHPSEDWFATGDEKGQLRLWYCLKDDLSFEKLGMEKTAPTTTLHWHAHAVRCIEFTSNGAYLLSGGEESVLVIWQLHTGKKEFVPRVGAPIQTIAVCNTNDMSREQEYLLGLEDGSFVFVRSSTLKIHRTIARVKLEPAHIKVGTPPPLVMHPQTRHLVLPSSHPSSIQIYSLQTSSLVSELEVAPSNRVSRPFDKPLVPSRVVHIALSDCGGWLATVDMRDDSNEGFGKEIFLKIWEWDATNNTWDLNTKIDSPHGDHSVNSLSFSPSSRIEQREPLLVSTGDDLNVKTWMVRVSSDKKAEVTKYWISRSSFSHRNQRPAQAAWSPDGSILAIAHGRVVTVWSVTTNALYGTITSADVSEFSRLVFTGKNARFICAASSKAFVLWDLISAKPVFTFKSSNHIVGLFSHRRSDKFAIAQELPSPTSSKSPLEAETLFTTFAPTSKDPIYNRRVPFSLRQCIPWQDNLISDLEPSYMGISPSGELIHIGDQVPDYSKEEGESKPLAAVDTGDSGQPTLFQDLFGKSAILNYDATIDKDSHAVKIGQDPRANLSSKDDFDWSLLEGPSHLLPSIQTLFNPLMESMLRTSVHAKSEQKDVDNDVEMETVVPEEQPTTTKGRRVSEEEMNTLIDLFREPIFSSKPEAPSTSPRIGVSPPNLPNGKVKNKGIPTTNGHVDQAPRVSMVNGASSTKHSKPTPPFHLPSSPSSPPPVPEPTIGKKRKKAMMS